MDAVTWFEIPAQDFERAANFYEKLLQITLRRELFGGDMPNAIFPYQDDRVGGSVVQVPYAQPGGDGAVVYLNAHSMAVFDHALAQVEALGGSIVMPKTDLGPIGHIALLTDTEGNRVGIHIAPEA